jgi:IclR family acetate operon transcriptional repressor
MGIKTADRTLDLLELFAREQRPLSLSEVAELMDIPGSSAHGLIKTLQSRGYLYEINRKQGYFPTKKLSTMASSITRAIPLLDKLEPYLSQLRDDTEETVVLAKQQGDLVVYLDVFESNQSVRFSPNSGELKLLHSTASGKTILASMPEHVREKFLCRVPLERRTPNTITEVERLRQVIEMGRQRGWFDIEGENIPDLMAIAAPATINDETYVIVIGGPIQRFKPRMNEHANKLLNVCNVIKKQEI